MIGSYVFVFDDSPFIVLCGNVTSWIGRGG